MQNDYINSIDMQNTMYLLVWLHLWNLIVRQIQYISYIPINIVDGFLRSYRQADIFHFDR